MPSLILLPFRFLSHFWGCVFDFDTWLDFLWLHSVFLAPICWFYRLFCGQACVNWPGHLVEMGNSRKLVTTSAYLHEERYIHLTIWGTNFIRLHHTVVYQRLQDFFDSLWYFHIGWSGEQFRWKKRQSPIPFIFGPSLSSSLSYRINTVVAWRCDLYIWPCCLPDKSRAVFFVDEGK